MNNWFRKVIGMTAPATAPSLPTDDHAAAAATGSTEIKNRCIAIMESEESVGRHSLAQHLALNTDLPVADALAALSVSPRKCETPEPTDAARTRQLDANFVAAFSRAEYAIPESPGEPVSDVARIQANYARARGEKPQS
jgi:hypothetical protein